MSAKAAPAPATAALDPFARRARLVAPKDVPHDGDSFWMEYDAGCGTRVEPELRLRDCYMPELAQPGGPQMRQVIVDWFAAADRALVWPFWISMSMTTRLRERGQKTTLTRYLAEVWHFDGTTTVGPSINTVLNAHLARHPEWGHGIGAQ